MSLYQNKKMAKMFDDLLGFKVEENKIFEEKNVKHIYSSYLVQFGYSFEGSRHEQLQDSDPEIIHNYPDEYNSALASLRVTKLIKYMLTEFCKDNSFTLSDLISPKENRTRRFFSLLIKAHLDVIHRLHDPMEAIMTRAGEMTAMREKKLAVIDQYRDYINQKKAKKEQDKCTFEKLTAMIGQISSEIQEDSGPRKMELKSQSNQLNEAIAEGKSAIHDLQIKQLQIQQDIEEAQSLLLSDKMKSEIDELQMEKEKAEAYCKERSEDLHMKKKMLSKCQDVREESLKNSLLPLYQELNKECKIIEEYKISLQTLLKKNAKEQESVEHCNSKYLENEQDLNVTGERMSQLLSSWDIKKHNLQQEIEQAKLNLEEIKKCNTEYEIVNAEIMSEISKHSEAILSTRQDLKLFDDEIREQYGKLKHMVSEQRMIRAQSSQQFHDLLLSLIENDSQSKEISDVLKRRKI